MENAKPKNKGQMTFKDAKKIKFGLEKRHLETLVQFRAVQQCSAVHTRTHPPNLQLLFCCSCRTLCLGGTRKGVSKRKRAILSLKDKH
jgi:hypothetical protein